MHLFQFGTILINKSVMICYVLMIFSMYLNRIGQRVFSPLFFTLYLIMNKY